jgi:Zn-dependent M28 family amino/carboxypeptidase
MGSPSTTSMSTLVEALCSDECSGRAPGTPGGLAARRHVVSALRDAGLDPYEQPLPISGGANVLATIPGVVDRWVLVGAHYDHLGGSGRSIFRGADDNAAAVAILIEVAKGLARARASGRGVILAAFDAEEPPWFLGGGMGSEHFARNPPVPLERIDLMVCMDLVGHALGPPGLPADVNETVFALGAERSPSTSALLSSMSAERGVTVRPADAEIIPPLSDYAAFWERERPFLFLTCGRSRVYHTTSDTPDLLDYEKMAATARWLESFTRHACGGDDAPFRFRAKRDDVATLDSLVALTRSIAPVNPRAQMALAMATALRGAVRKDGTVPDARRGEIEALVMGLEQALA